MELAGLEPATSWVRFRLPTRSTGAHLQALYRTPWHTGADSDGLGLQAITGVKATKPTLWPKPSGNPEPGEGAVARADKTAADRPARQRCAAAQVVPLLPSNERRSHERAVSVPADS